MNDKEELILGIDLCNRYSQVCYFDMKTQTPESVPLVGKMLILENSVPLPIILERMQEGITDEEDDLTSLLKKILESTFIYKSHTEIPMICITVEDFNITLLDAIKSAFLKLGYNSDKLMFISHEESSAYYAFSMKKELWNGGVVLLNYNSMGIDAFVLSEINHKANHMIVEEHKKFKDSALIQVIEGNKTLTEVDTLLEDIAKQMMKGKVISSIYLTGAGFDTEYLPPAFLKFICNRHRVFVGQNLYVKGACFAAYESKYGKRFENTILSCKNRITTGIEIEIVERSKNKIFRIAKPGINWYGAGKTVDFIVDNCSEIKLNMIPLDGKEQYKEIIDISEIPYRADKTTRIKIKFEFPADDRCLVTVKDKGFGEIARSSGKVIYKNLEM